MKTQLYYDGSGYWVETTDPSHQFLPVNQKAALWHLQLDGLDVEEFVAGMKAGERALVQAQVHRYVSFAGPLAGHKRGMKTLPDGTRYLVTSSFKESLGTVGKDISASNFRAFIRELVGDDQALRLEYWMKVGRESLLAGDFRPGQALVLAGPAGCGKSLLQALLTEWFGGREGRPYRYMSGETPFNGDLAGAEHLVIEDEHASTDMRTRRKVGSALKLLTFCQNMSVHPKGRQAITLPVFHRLSITINDEPENLCFLPPIDPSLEDKQLILVCRPVKGLTDRKKDWARLSGDLPALESILKRTVIPKAMREPRCGVAAWQNPSVLDVLRDMENDVRLLSLIDETLFHGGTTERQWEGSADALHSRLIDGPRHEPVRQLLHYPGQTGHLLSRLKRRHPERVTSRCLNGRTVWKITG